jgi:glycosyltransferase involved in cell wall biosynthesis
LNILFINFRTNGSSALGRTAMALKENGVMVKSFTYLALIKEDIPIRISKFDRFLFFLMFLNDLFITRLFYRNNGIFFSRNLGLFSGYLARKYNEIFNSVDLVHLHWVGHGFMSADFLLKLNLKKLVITFHDYYFLTGGCHVPMECDKYVTECRNCPSRSLFYDFQLKNFNEKKKLFERLNVYALAPSKTMATKIRNSELGKLIYKVIVIPNPLDVNVFKPLDPLAYESDFKYILPETKKVVLFVANNLSDKNKGLDLLYLALEYIKDKSNFCLVTVGNNMPKQLGNSGFEIIHLGALNNTVKIYNRAYITVVPSRFESFSQVTLESLSCGTPVIAFDSSGPSEIISNNINGFLVQDFSIVELGRKIERLLLDPLERKLFSENGRRLVKNKYSLKSVGELLKSEYNSIINS